METARLENVFQIAVHFVALIARRNALVEKRFADVVIEVDAKGISLFDLHKSRLLIERGHRAAEQKLDEIKEKLKMHQQETARLRHGLSAHP